LSASSITIVSIDVIVGNSSHTYAIFSGEAIRISTFVMSFLKPASSFGIIPSRKNFTRGAILIWLSDKIRNSL